MNQISDNVADVLRSATISGNQLTLNGQIDRATYQSVDKVLKAFGGKWNRKAQVHIFDRDPTDKIMSAIDTNQYIDPKKQFQFFETPAARAKIMVDLAMLSPGGNVLEPSAGRGAIIKAMPTGSTRICAVELNPDFIEDLGKNMGISHLIHDDFLKLQAPIRGELFDAVIMNPPFSKNQDTKHIRHAWNFLKPGGRLVAICGEGAFFRDYREESEFRHWLLRIDAENEQLPAGEFKESGTNVKTRMIVARKDI